MTVREILTAVRTLKPSQYDDETLVRWMSELEARIWQDVTSHYTPAEGTMPAAGTPAAGTPAEGAPAAGTPAAGALKAEDLNHALLVPFPHDDIYIKWLCVQIDYHNGEYDRYNNGLVTFNAGLQAFADWYNREHMPRQDNILRM